MPAEASTVKASSIPTLSLPELAAEPRGSAHFRTIGLDGGDLVSVDRYPPAVVRVDGQKAISHRQQPASDPLASHRKGYALAYQIIEVI